MYTVTRENILQFLQQIRSSGKKVVAPTKVGQKIFFRDIVDPGTITFDYIQTTESPKDVVFPRVEPMLAHRYSAGNVQLVDFAENMTPPDVVLFGTRPCDAVALSMLVEFFKEGVGDPFVEQRADHLTVVSISCTQADAYCFCTSVNVSPGDERGSDVLLTPIESNRYAVEILTEKGKALIESAQQYFEHSETIDRGQHLAHLEREFTPEELTERLANAFDHPLWNEASLRCIGCGACAYVCPLCSCFDIQDEGTQTRGVRLRCWDSCGFSLFTLHTSGHNPRHIQSERWRQRVMHKFSYIPRNLNLLGCVGCGRCSRACPADMNLKEHLVTLKNEIPVSK